jgi:hypothetical protein
MNNTKFSVHYEAPNDERAAQGIKLIVVDSYIDDFCSGYICINNLSDLCDLRDAIEDFISQAQQSPVE